MGNVLWISLWAAAAWGIALLLIRPVPGTALCWGAAAGTACGLTAYVLYVAGLGNAVPWGALLLFLLLAVLVWLREKTSANAAAAFLTAVGATSVFSLAERQLGQALDARWGGWGSVLLAAAFLCLALAVRDSLLPENWRECFAAAAGGGSGWGLRGWQVYALLLQDCLLDLAGIWLLPAMAPGAAVLTVALLSALFWITLLAAALLVRNRQENAVNQIDQQYRGEVERFINVIRSQRHDYNFHVQTLAGLIQEGNWDACRDYVHALEQDSSRMNALLPLHDPAISAMIHSFQTLMARAGIELHVSIQNDLSKIATSVYETNKIISNLLQNALDETVTHADKSYGVRLSIMKRGEFCVIRVSNRLQGDPQGLEDLYRQGYTTKSGHDGVGLSSICTLAARYKGTIYTHLEGNIIHFVAKIPLNYAKGA